MSPIIYDRQYLFFTNLPEIRPVEKKYIKKGFDQHTLKELAMLCKFSGRKVRIKLSMLFIGSVSRMFLDCKSAKTVVVLTFIDNIVLELIICSKNKSFKTNFIPINNKNRLYKQFEFIFLILNFQFFFSQFMSFSICQHVQNTKFDTICFSIILVFSVFFLNIKF